MHAAIDRLEKTLESSFNRYIDSKRPLLLALSGGSDSMALLGLLVSLKKRRMKARTRLLFCCLCRSSVEGRKPARGSALQHYTEKLGIPFFTHRLDGVPFNEEVARRGRLNCFRMLMQQTEAQAVCLAHHRDDQEDASYAFSKAPASPNCKACRSSRHVMMDSAYGALFFPTGNKIYSSIFKKKDSPIGKIAPMKIPVFYAYACGKV